MALGCPEKFLINLLQFCKGMCSRIKIGTDLSEIFSALMEENKIFLG